MRFLDVKGVLDREESILERSDTKTVILKELDDKTTSYAILSHRWGNEVNYDEMTELMKMEEQERDEVRQRGGYQKIIKSCEQAMRDGYRWLWIDTCCIDKRSSAELSEAINSMYRWYRNSQRCYVYLNDVDESAFPTRPNESKYDSSNGWPEWFIRGWTLQELIAAKEVQFFNKDWTFLGNKQTLADTLKIITRIPDEVLRDGLTSKCPSVARVMSWAADRKTTRVEDRAYSLLGLFGVNMPMLYGEGEKAFQRLQLEILRVSSDHSIFAWDTEGWIRRPGSVLANDPSYFRDCHHIERVEPDEFVDRLVEYIEQLKLGNSRSNTHRRALASLRGAAHSQQYRTFSVTNAGIQLCLPLIPYRDSPTLFKAILACRNRRGDLISIDLASSGSCFDRTFDTTGIHDTYPEFRTLGLSCSQDANETYRDLTLDDKHTLHYGFTRCGAFPRDTSGDAVKLWSRTNDLIVIVYASDLSKCRFAVGLGYHFDQGWVHIAYEEHPAPQGEAWIHFAKKVYDVMWNARAYHARNMPKLSYDENAIKHAHLPRSIWAARVVWGRWDASNLRIMIDVEQCSGCCVGPHGWTVTSNDRDGLGIPGLMKTLRRSHCLELDGRSVWFDECSHQRIALGDYGDFSDGHFKRYGNVLEHMQDMQSLGFDPTDPAYRPVVSRASGYHSALNRMQNRNDLVATFHNEERHLELYQPVGLSLPNNRHFTLLLKALSTRLADKHLVIRVIQCSQVYAVDRMGERKDLGGSARDGGRCSLEPSTYTPLCTIASPQVWRRGPACVLRREQFKGIREHFYTLVNLRRPGGSETRRKSAIEQATNEATKFFSDMFGFEYLHNFVGKVTFFERLPSITQTELHADASRGIVNGNGLGAPLLKFSFVSWVVRHTPFKGRRTCKAVPDPRLEMALLFLRKKCQVLGSQFRERQNAVEKRNMDREVQSISQTLSVGLLDFISTTFIDSRSPMKPKYDKYADACSMVQEIKALREKLDATDDEDEMRALEEDITGKILWLCWCGICQEVEQLLPQVVDYLGNEGNMTGLGQIGRIIEGTHTDPNDDQAHLRRIMADAGAGTSKHQLLLTAWAAQHTLGTAVSGDKPVLGTQEAVPSTSYPGPSALAV